MPSATLKRSISSYINLHHKSPETYAGEGVEKKKPYYTVGGIVN